MKIPKLVIVFSIIGILVLLVGLGIATWYIFFNKPNTVQNQTNPQNNRGNLMARDIQTYSGKIGEIQDNQLILNLDDNKGQKIIRISAQTQYRDIVADTKENIIKVDNTILIKGAESNGVYKAEEVSIATNNQPQINRPGPSGSQTGKDYLSRGSNMPNNPFTGRNNMLIGKITKIEDNKVTVSMNQGGEKIIDISSTKFLKTQTIELKDFKVDDKVTINGINQPSFVDGRVITRIH